MTEASWDDYISTDPVETSDPSLAVPEIADQIHELDDAADSSGAVSDLDQVSLDSAAYQGDLAVGEQSWADWNNATGDEALGNAQDYVDYAKEQAAAGNTDIAETAYAQAGDYLDYADDKYDAANTNEASASDHLETASDYIGSVDTAAESAEGTDYSSTDYPVETPSTDYSSTDYSSTDYSSTDYSSTDYSADTSTSDYSSTDYSADTSSSDSY